MYQYKCKIIAVYKSVIVKDRAVINTFHRLLLAADEKQSFV